MVDPETSYSSGGRLGGPYGGGFSLYFAYGSNLDTAQMRSRCPEAVPLVSAELKSHRLSFQNHANVLPARRSSVQGGLYLLNWRDGQALDHYEGVSRGYYERVYSFVSWDPAKILSRYLPSIDHLPVFFYRMINQEQYRDPSNSYFGTLLEGYRDWGLNERALMKTTIWGPKLGSLISDPPTKRSKSGVQIWRLYRDYTKTDPVPPVRAQEVRV